MQRLAGCRAAAVSVLTAVMLIPMIGFVGLAIDYGFWTQAYEEMALAANAAAMNAAKSASASAQAGNTNYIADGQLAGKQWFKAQMAGHATAAVLAAITPTVTVTNAGGQITAVVTATATMTAIFGKMFAKQTYPVQSQATSIMSGVPYREILILLDNASSMDIGATPADMTILLQNSPCDPSNYILGTSGAQASIHGYGTYEKTNPYNGISYSPTNPAYPVVAPSSTRQAVATTYSQTNAAKGPACYKSATKQRTVSGQAVYAGPPCAFACHWDGSAKAGTTGTVDLWQMARSLSPAPVLRLDTVKIATNTILQQMATYNISALNNLTAGIFAANLVLSQVYPTSGEANSNFTAATEAVGWPPNTGTNTSSTVDTGIQPMLTDPATDINDGNIAAALTALSLQLTTSGTGTTSTSPAKFLFIVTDGIDTSTGTARALPYAACQPLKNMGYQIYVVYTPYYPLTDIGYLGALTPIVEGTGSATITYNLQACTSASSDGSNLSSYYIAASDQTTLTTALQTFLQSALGQAARFTK
jgi:hypothetical protein